MKSIRTAFTCAAECGTGSPGFSIYWLMVFAIAIIDDSEQREKERRKYGLAHMRPMAAFQEDLRAKLSAQLRDRRRRGAQHIEASDASVVA